MTKDLTRKEDKPIVRSSMSGLSLALLKDQDAERLETVEMAESVLMELGLQVHQDKVPQPRHKEDVNAYLARVWDQLSEDLQAHIEVAGISQMISLSRAGEKAIQQRLYRQFVTGTWERYGAEVGINFFRDYVYYILRETHGLKGTKAGRWADALQLIGWLYIPANQDRFDLKGLPTTAQECIHGYLNRFGRHGYRIWQLIAQTESMTIKLSWRMLKEQRRQGEINPDNPQDERQPTQLYRLMYKIRRLLSLALDLGVSSEILDQAGRGNAPNVEPIFWPEEIVLTPAQRGLLESRLGDLIHFTTPDLSGMRRVQYKLEMLPLCPECGEILSIQPGEGFFCRGCGNTELAWVVEDELEAEHYRPFWQSRHQAEEGMSSWVACEPPEMETWTPEKVEVAGITCLVFNTIEKDTHENYESEEDKVDGLLWFDDGGGRPVESKIVDACRRFEKKFGQGPSAVYVNPTVDDIQMVVYDGNPVEVKLDRFTRPNYFRAVLEEVEDGE